MLNSKKYVKHSKKYKKSKKSKYQKIKPNKKLSKKPTKKPSKKPTKKFVKTGGRLLPFNGVPNQYQPTGFGWISNSNAY